MPKIKFINTIRDYPSDQIPKYWELVEKTLVEVFKRKPDPACQLGNKIRSASDEEQLYFYHKQPLDVAADLVGTRPTPSQVDAYLDLARRLGWL